MGLESSLVSGCDNSRIGPLPVPRAVLPGLRMATSSAEVDVPAGVVVAICGTIGSVGRNGLTHIQSHPSLVFECLLYCWFLYMCLFICCLIVASCMFVVGSCVCLLVCCLIVGSCLFACLLVFVCVFVGVWYMTEVEISRPLALHSYTNNQITKATTCQKAGDYAWGLG